MLDSDLGYLAAIIDGEGCITLDRTGKRRLAGVMGLQPKVIVTNTNRAIIQHVINLFLRLGVTPHVKGQLRRDMKSCYWVMVSGLTKSAKVLNILKPYLVGKVAQAQLVLDFIELRGDSRLAKGKPYGDSEMRILEQIRALNHRGVSTTDNIELAQAAA